MPSPGWTRIVIALAAGVWAAILILSGEQLQDAWAKPLGLTTTIVIWLLLAFDLWIWRWPLVRRILRRPVFSGTWQLELRTSYRKRKDEVITSFLVVRQTYSRISVAMLADRSRSRSMSADLLCEDGLWLLYYVFRSDKHALQPEENPPARGAAHLTVATTPKVHLEGDYWMERGTQGRIRSVGHSRDIYDTYQAASEGTYVRKT
jgi:hypothetical protein